MTNKLFSLVFLGVLVFGVFALSEPVNVEAQVASSPPGCNSVIGYSSTTGLPCNGGIAAQTALFPGCTSVVGVSTMTGLPCSGGTTPLSFLPGCTSIYGVSSINGLPCKGLAVATPFPPGVPGLPITGSTGNTLENLGLLTASGILALLSIGILARRRKAVLQ